MFFSKAPSMTLGIAALAAPGRGPRDDLWMGSAAGEPIPWRVLSREGNGGRYRNAAGEEVSGPALLLVTSCLLGNHFQDGIKKDSDLRFYQEGTEPDTEDPALLWRQSAARAWCGDFFASCLSPLEQEAVLAVWKDDPEYSPVGWSSRPVPGASGILDGDRVFFLSAQEVENEEYGFKNKQRIVEHLWWTRSYRGTRNYRGRGEYGAGITINGGLQQATCDSRQFARPAVVLDPAAVLFTTPAPQGWRLTLRDRTRETFSLGQPVREGQTLVLPYRNAFPADAPDPAGERISVIVAAPDGVARDYRAIARPAAPDGVARLELSGLKRKKGDRLLVFSERQEEKQVTGYASPLIQVPEN